MHVRLQQFFFLQTAPAGAASWCPSGGGSVLGRILFLLYTAELFDVTAGRGFAAHSYADDTQDFQYLR